MVHGSAVISSGSSGSSSRQNSYTGHTSHSSGSTSSLNRSYVDNGYNRSVGRVGLEVGSMVISKNNNSSTKSNYHSNEKTYVDNSFNCRVGRVGLEVGSVVISKNNDSSTQSNHQFPEKSQKTKIHEEKRMGVEAVKLTENNHKSKKVYVDNAFNRRHGRVGFPLGSKPLRKKVEAVALPTFPYEEIRPQLNDYSEYDNKLQEIIQNLMDRRAIKNNLALESQELIPINTLQSFANISGKDVAYEELELVKKIGSGGFGEVYLSKRKDTIVAVKKLRLQRISKNRLKDFTKEVTNYYMLNHPNVVKFLGACTVTPLCIIMEYMDMSLFEAKIDIDFSEEERLKIISQVCKGLLYLHENRIAHCDLKTQNILIRYNEKENVCVAKICDFGLSIIKHNTETSGSSIEQHFKNIGTPRYSAPEVLRGELIATSAWFMCNIYSLSLILFEIIYEEEPFNNLSYVQLQKQVGENGITPDIPRDVSVDINIINLMKSCWIFSPVQRPKINEIEKKVNRITKIYCD
ncbi:probable serine/threonine-protein kinase DDB_G0267514 [Hydra vulgaris]|uniref:Probable serine/threonine-protein kinase DDB_G0267514 n=1 Tax=Hydra vulgaris TaxID=6087 RepID=A0ABM4CE57_HYDVU